jgi:8-oxo-dGTP diphosphatase
VEGALREAVEETGIDTTLLTALQTFCDDHGSWKYETVIARAADGLVAFEVNDESHEVRWVEIDQVEQLPLHPSFAKSWPELMEILNNLIGPR